MVRQLNISSPYLIGGCLTASEDLTYEAFWSKLANEFRKGKATISKTKEAKNRVVEDFKKKTDQSLFRN